MFFCYSYFKLLFIDPLYFKDRERKRDRSKMSHLLLETAGPRSDWSEEPRTQSTSLLNVAAAQQPEPSPATSQVIH